MMSPIRPICPDRTSHGWRRDPLWRALARLDIRWRRVLSAILLGVGALGSALALAAVSAWLIARASQMPPVMHLSVAVVGVRAFGISRGVFRYLERLASHDLALRGMATFRENIYVSLASGRAAAVAPLRRGDLLARVGHDVDDVGDVVVRSLIPAGVALVLSLGAVILVGAFLPAAGLVLALCLVVAGAGVPWLTARATREAAERDRAARTAMSETVLRIVEHAPQLVVAGSLPAQFAQVHAADSALTASADDSARPLAWAAALNSVVVGIAVLGSLLLGIPALTAGNLAAVELAVIVLTPLAAFEAAGVLPAAAVQMSRSRLAAARIMALLDAAAPDSAPGSTLVAPEHRAPTGTETDPTAEYGAEPKTDVVRRAHQGAEATGARPPEPGPVLRARNVTCGWAAHEPVLAGLDLDLTPGRVVALVGPSGVGKTTALLTLAGLLPPVSGDLLVPAGDVILTTEDAHLFRTTVLENLRVARANLTEADALAALTMVGLGPWLANLPAGLATILGPDGSTVSGGERRRLLLARAWLSPARLILVDEPAEHLDADSADLLFTDVLTDLASRGRGVLVATHRLSGLGIADDVLRLAAPGSGTPGIAARGTHAYLLEHDRAYRGAWKREQRSPHSPILTTQTTPEHTR